MERLCSYWTDFHEISYLNVFEHDDDDDDDDDERV